MSNNGDGAGAIVTPQTESVHTGYSEGGIDGVVDKEVIGEPADTRRVALDCNLLVVSEKPFDG